MGNEESTMVDEATAPITLESRTLDGLAKYMKSGKVKKAVVMVCLLPARLCGANAYRSQ